MKTCRYEQCNNNIVTVYITAVVTAALTNHSWGLWIGYREYQGKWLWADNSDPNSFTNWAPEAGYVSTKYSTSGLQLQSSFCEKAVDGRYVGNHLYFSGFKEIDGFGVE